MSWIVRRAASARIVTTSSMLGLLTLQEKPSPLLHVRDYPLIHQGGTIQEGKAQPVGYPTNNSPVTTKNLEQNGYLLIHELWQRGTNSIHNVHVVKTDALSHRNKSTEKCLQMAEKEKKKKYLESCLQQHRHFYPFVVSADGLLEVEVEATLKFTAIHLAMKWKHP